MRKNSHDRILTRESYKEQHLSIVPISCPNSDIYFMISLK